MKPLRTERLILRNWEDRDCDLFFRINSDPTVMEFFPFRRGRRQSEDLMDLLAGRIDEHGFGFCAVEIAATGETAGFAGLSLTDGIPGLPDGSIEIGWRLAPEHWGKGYATEAARAWLDWGFANLPVEEIVSFAVDGNHRSTAVMQRLGLERAPARDFDHPRVPDTHPHLKRHVFYALARPGAAVTD